MLNQALSFSNVIVLLIIGGGNLLTGIVTYLQNDGQTGCIATAIYYNMTETDFTNCLLDRGWYSMGSIQWIMIEFVLIVASIMILIFVNTKKTDEK